MEPILKPASHKQYFT